MNRDPRGERGGYDLFVFEHNKPTIAIDPDGRIELVPIAIGIVVVAGILEVANAWHHHCKCADAADKMNAEIKSCRDEFNALGPNPTYEQIIKFCDK